MQSPRSEEHDDEAHNGDRCEEYDGYAENEDYDHCVEDENLLPLRCVAAPSAMNFRNTLTNDAAPSTMNITATPTNDDCTRFSHDTLVIC